MSKTRPIQRERKVLVIKKHEIPGPTVPVYESGDKPKTREPRFPMYNLTKADALRILGGSHESTA